MYTYLFEKNTLKKIAVKDYCPDGFTTFVGNPLATSDGFVDWSKVKYDNGELSLIPVPEPEPPYIPTLDEVKLQRKEYIKVKRNQAEAATPFVYDGSLFDYDSLSRERINSAVIGSTIASVSGVPISTVVSSWRLYDNSERDMTVADWLAFKQAEIARSTECFAKAARLKSDIESATTIEAVNAIDW